MKYVAEKAISMKPQFKDFTCGALEVFMCSDVYRPRE